MKQEYHHPYAKEGINKMIETLRQKLLSKKVYKELFSKNNNVLDIGKVADKMGVSKQVVWDKLGHDSNQIDKPSRDSSDVQGVSKEKKQ